MNQSECRIQQFDWIVQFWEFVNLRLLKFTNYGSCNIWLQDQELYYPIKLLNSAL